VSQSIRSLQRCARWHLCQYTKSDGPFAFTAYDVQGAPDRLELIDCLAPALLNAPIRGSSIIEMNRPGTPEAQLFDAMCGLLTDPACADARFLDCDIDGPALRRLAAVIGAAQTVHGIKAVKVSKILHRKRPHLVPLIDSAVTTFFTGAAVTGVRTEAIQGFWRALQADLRQNTGWLTVLAADYPTPDQRKLSLLRAADIIVWHHQHSCRPGNPSCPAVGLGQAPEP
jgi:hypothetical protein